MYRYEKHFSLEEAMSYLIRLEYDVGELSRLKTVLDNNGFNIYTRKYRTGFNPDTLNEFPDEFLQFVEIIQALTNEGMIVKGIEQGLVDFPARRANGEEVYLCWKSGEETILFWHTLEGGFRGRRPITEF